MKRTRFVVVDDRRRLASIWYRLIDLIIVIKARKVRKRVFEKEKKEEEDDKTFNAKVVVDRSSRLDGPVERREDVEITSYTQTGRTGKGRIRRVRGRGKGIWGW